MKILGINSSPRGKNSRTLKLVNAVLDGAKERGAETELVDIGALDIQYCMSKAPISTSSVSAPRSFAPSRTAFTSLSVRLFLPRGLLFIPSIFIFAPPLHDG